MKSIIKHRGILLSMRNPKVKERFSHLRVRFGKKWETKEREMILKYLPENENYIELGGCIGFTSLTARKHKNTKKHIIVEANPNLIETLKENKELSGFKDIVIINKAYSTKKGEIEFTVSSTGIGSSSIFRKEGKKIKIETIKLRDILNYYSIDKFNLMCDVEGSESELLTDEIDLLKKHCNLLIIELHKDHEKWRDRLVKNGFTLLDKSNNVYAFRNNILNIP